MVSRLFTACSKLELEKTGKGRLETQVARLREVVERQGKEAEGLRAREKAASEEAKKATKQWREVRIYPISKLPSIRGEYLSQKL